jgi:uncharacterized alkaline shock family protein YloU
VPEKNKKAGGGNSGETSYAENIVENIIGIAVSQIAGVAALSKLNVSCADKKPAGLTVDTYVSVDYGARIPEVAYKIQHSVKESLESTTQYKVDKVNVHVTGVVFSEKTGPAAKEEIPVYGLQDKK